MRAEGNVRAAETPCQSENASASVVELSDSVLLREDLQMRVRLEQHWGVWARELTELEQR